MFVTVTTGQFCGAPAGGLAAEQDRCIAQRVPTSELAPFLLSLLHAMPPASSSRLLPSLHAATCTSTQALETLLQGFHAQTGANATAPVGVGVGAGADGRSSERDLAAGGASAGSIGGQAQGKARSGTGTKLSQGKERRGASSSSHQQQHPLPTSTAHAPVVSVVIIDFVDGKEGSRGGAGAAAGPGSHFHSFHQQQFVSPRDKKLAGMRRKEREQVPDRVLGALREHGAAAGGMPWHAQEPSSRVQVVVRPVGHSYSAGMVLAVDLPLVVLRALNTFLLTALGPAAPPLGPPLSASPAGSVGMGYSGPAGAGSLTGVFGGGGGGGAGSAVSVSPAQQSFAQLLDSAEGLVVGTAAGSRVSAKRALRLLVAQLCTYCRQIGSRNSGGSASSDSAAGSSRSGGGGGRANKGSRGSADPRASRLAVFLYSIPDDQLDFLSCRVDMLLEAKLL